MQASGARGDLRDGVAGRWYARGPRMQVWHRGGHEGRFVRTCRCERRRSADPQPVGIRPPCTRPCHTMLSLDAVKSAAVQTGPAVRGSFPFAVRWPGRGVVLLASQREDLAPPRIAPSRM